MSHNTTHAENIDTHDARAQADDAMELAQSLRNRHKKAGESPKGGDDAHQTNSSDPVADMGREIARIWPVMNDLDKRMINGPHDPIECGRLQDLHDELNDKKDALLEMSTTIPATSLEGAMLQAMWALSCADDMSTFPEPEHKLEVDNHMRRINRCLRSIIDVLEKETGTDPKELGGNCLLLPINPHKDMAAALEPLDS